ncbi:hypothetical protein H0H92_011744 [Tricholoma furcatifolium]|nr:hypothetical protein H0H92_011744 [Tricholoma furcatifolium]
MASRLTSLPLEIINHIVFHLSCLQPLGPPSIIIPLMQTCRTINHLLLPENNPVLYGDIYCFKFDTGAVIRRAFTPTHIQYTSQFRRVLAAMRVFRSQDVDFQRRPQDFEFELDLSDVLYIAVTMMLEDDGRNSAQLLLWAGADVFIKNFVLKRLYQHSQHNDGWPLAGYETSNALWLMWLLTSEEALLKETPAERAQMQELLLPLACLPVRYSTAYAPPHVFHLHTPGTSSSTMNLSTFDTPHGPYPVYSDVSYSNNPFYDARCIFACPPAAAAAKLLYAAREEVIPQPIPEEIYREGVARRLQGVHNSVTPEDLEELNWGWDAHLPLGSGFRDRSGARRMVDGWGGLEWDSPLDDSEEEEPYPERPAAPTPPNFIPPPPTEKWKGRAPHASAFADGSQGSNSKSRKWDMDWMRLRFCGSITRPPPRIPYGRVYEPGVMSGLWQGVMLVPPREFIQDITTNARHPPLGTLHSEMRTLMHMKIVVRFHELHGVQDEATSDFLDYPFSCRAPGYTNGWFPGDKAPSIPAPRANGKAYVRAGEEGRTYRYWRPNDQGARRLGNDALSSTEIATGVTERLRPAPEEAQYKHGARSCRRCCDNKKYQHLNEQRKHPSSDSGNEIDDKDGLLETWDGEDNLSDNEDPHAHDRDRRGQGKCDGIRDILLVGHVDSDHAAAFGDHKFYGRIRPWDGMVNFVRMTKYVDDDGRSVWGTTNLFGNIVGYDTIVGTWRWGDQDPAIPGWEGPFTLSRRLD